MVSVQNLSKHYGSRVIFDNVTFTVNAGERVGLVGRNGYGKTTLFRLLAGEESVDGGTVVFSRDYSVGCLSQHLDFKKPTLLEEACLGLKGDREGDLWRAEKILAGLGFSEKDLERSPQEFSGGYQGRLNLAKVLLEEPDLLLLDEPTNFLDILSIRWLEKFLSTWKGELIIISHDRNFMDSIITHVIGIHRSKARKVRGTTDKYYAQIEQDEVLYEKRRVGEAKKRKQTEQFIRRFRAKARQASLAQSRMKTLEKQEQLEKLEEIKKLYFSFKSEPFPARRVMKVDNLLFSYNGSAPWLIKGLSFDVEIKDRICIIGRNGNGKTTLMKLIAGRLEPLEGGIKNHPKLSTGYFEQINTVSLDDSMTVEEEIMASHPSGDRKEARDACGAMMFSGDDATKKIRVLSGGEKCRVLLAKLLVTPFNMLLLDEPTHHLDMESCDALAEAAASFGGAVVMVTHDESILRRVATKLIVFGEEGVFVFPGTYDEFINQVGWGDNGQGILVADKRGESDRKKVGRKELKKMRANLVTRRSKALNSLKGEIDKIEGELKGLEDELSILNSLILKASEDQDGKAISSHSLSIKGLEGDIAALYEALDTVLARQDKEQKAFAEEERVLLGYWKH